MAYRLTETAERHIGDILLESTREHGTAAAHRYALLIVTAMAALGDDPKLAGSREIPRLGSIRAYPLRFAKFRVEPLLRVGTPRHLIIYRSGADGIVEILGMAHDRMILTRAARQAMRESEKP